VLIELNTRTLSGVSGVDVYETLLHEIAHVLAGHAAKHKPAWRSVVYRLGGNPRARCRRDGIEPAVVLVCDRPHQPHVHAGALIRKPKWNARVGQRCGRAGCDGKLRIVYAPKT
jgi:hypothetical protein